MLTDQRKQFLLDHLRTHGEIIAKALSAQLGLSEDTIRRDLRELAAEGKLIRVHGGALPVSPTVKDLQDRSTLGLAEKQLLGRAAGGMIQNGQTVFVDGGTTHEQLLKAIPLDASFTLVTHSPTIAASLARHQSLKVLLIGGVLFRHSMVALGTATMEAVWNMRFDLAFIGANGVHETEGLTTGDFEEATFKTAVMNRSAETVALMTQDKIGTVAAHRICAVRDLSCLVVVKAAKEKFRSKLDINLVWA